MFVRYCERAAKHLGDLIGAATTFNEPNIPVLLQWMFARMPQNPFAGVGRHAVSRPRKLIGSDRFSAFMTGDAEKERDMMVPAHHSAMAAMKAGPGKYPVGVNLAMSDDQAVPARKPRATRSARRSTARGWRRRPRATSSASRPTRARASARTATCRPTRAPSSRRWATSSGPRRSSRRSATPPRRRKVPVYVTENGIGTEDDTRRVEYIKRALAGVRNCLRDRSTSAATSTGRCSTTSSGTSATARSSASSPSIARRRSARPSRAHSSWAISRGGTRSRSQ